MGPTSHKVRQTEAEGLNQVISRTQVLKGSGNILELYARNCFYEHICIAYIVKKVMTVHIQTKPMF